MRSHSLCPGAQLCQNKLQNWSVLMMWCFSSDILHIRLCKPWFLTFWCTRTSLPCFKKCMKVLKKRFGMQKGNCSGLHNHHHNVIKWITPWFNLSTPGWIKPIIIWHGALCVFLLKIITQGSCAYRGKLSFSWSLGGPYLFVKDRECFCYLSRAITGYDCLGECLLMIC